jgi:hypothetical protein
MKNREKGGCADELDTRAECDVAGGGRGHG